MVAQKNTWLVSIHTLHELEARAQPLRLRTPERSEVSIHTLHELEASAEQTAVRGVVRVSIHTLHELEARCNAQGTFAFYITFPFIRFTNWKQAFFDERGWQFLSVSIHTLHELEARRSTLRQQNGTS